MVNVEILIHDIAAAPTQEVQAFLNGSDEVAVTNLHKLECFPFKSDWTLFFLQTISFLLQRGISSTFALDFLRKKFHFNPDASIGILNIVKQIPEEKLILFLRVYGEYLPRISDKDKFIPLVFPLFYHLILVDLFYLSSQLSSKLKLIRMPLINQSFVLYFPLFSPLFQNHQKLYNF
jgi:hypothetical protein